MSATGHTAAKRPFELVVLVASLGGIRATSAVLAGLPAHFDTPIVVVQHRTGGYPDRLPDILGRRALPVRSARAGLSAREPGVTVVPGGSVATLDSGYRFAVRAASGGPNAAGDAMLVSASALAGPSVVGVILSGRLQDGTKGTRALKRRGGRVIAQDPATAREPSMPLSAIAAGCADFVLSPQRTADALVALTMAPGGAELLTVPTPPWANLDAG